MTNILRIAYVEDPNTGLFELFQNVEENGKGIDLSLATFSSISSLEDYMENTFTKVGSIPDYNLYTRNQ